MRPCYTLYSARVLEVACSRCGNFNVQVQHFLAAAVGAPAGEAERSLMAAAATTAGTFAVGDVVVVTTGDLENMKGEVAEVEPKGDRVFVLPKDLPDFHDKLEFRRSELQKFIAVGARVRVRARLPDSYLIVI